MSGQNEDPSKLAPMPEGFVLIGEIIQVVDQNAPGFWKRFGIRLAAILVPLLVLSYLIGLMAYPDQPWKVLLVNCGMLTLVVILATKGYLYGSSYVIVKQPGGQKVRIERDLHGVAEPDTYLREGLRDAIVNEDGETLVLIRTLPKDGTFKELWVAESMVSKDWAELVSVHYHDLFAMSADLKLGNQRGD